MKWMKRKLKDFFLFLNVKSNFVGGDKFHFRKRASTFSILTYLRMNKLSCCIQHDKSFQGRNHDAICAFEFCCKNMTKIYFLLRHTWLEICENFSPPTKAWTLQILIKNNGSNWKCLGLASHPFSPQIDRQFSSRYRHENQTFRQFTFLFNNKLSNSYHDVTFSTLRRCQ